MSLSTNHPGKKGPQGKKGLCSREARTSQNSPPLLGWRGSLGREGRKSRREGGGGSSEISRAHSRHTSR